MDTTTVNCICWGKTGHLETCTILNYGKPPDCCSMRMEGKKKLTQAEKEKFWEDGE